jgi:hypothetical protein
MAFDPAPDPDPGSGTGLCPAERARLDAVRSADSLAALAALVDADSGRDAYLAVKPEWRDLRQKELEAASRLSSGELPGELPGDSVVVDETTFHVHGITHAGTEAERDVLREHVATSLDDGAAIYCEQGIRSMYLSDRPAVCEMDDYRWAMQRCAGLDSDGGTGGTPSTSETGFDRFGEEVSSLAAQFRDTAFSLIDSGSDVYGDAYARALGDVASDFLTSHEDLATGTDFRSFRLSREASADPRKLAALQRYYTTAFLPQPLEREWLARHDRKLELLTHARNERMADYAVAHADGARRVHLIVGAAHQPGVVYYLDEHRNGRRTVGELNYVA